MKRSGNLFDSEKSVINKKKNIEEIIEVNVDLKKIRVESRQLIFNQKNNKLSENSI